MTKRTTSQKIVFAIVFVVFLLYAIYLLLPIFFAFNASLKNGTRAFNKDMIGWAFGSGEPKFGNYLTAFEKLELQKTDFFGMTVNSLVYALGSTFCGIMSSTFLAYAVCKYDFKLKNFLYSLALFVMIIPIYGSLPATYRLLDKLQFTNSWFYLLSTAGGFGFNFIVIHSFFEGVSNEYAEAAKIDGAGHFRVFFTIMLPMAIPSITAIAVTAFIGAWNDYMTPLLYFRKLPTLSSGLWSYYQKIQYLGNEPVYFAGVLISLVPVVVLFLSFQNTVMEKVYAGGLKG